jgi:hypothetical protein
MQKRKKDSSNVATARLVLSTDLATTLASQSMLMLASPRRKTRHLQPLH